MTSLDTRTAKQAARDEQVLISRALANAYQRQCAQNKRKAERLDAYALMARL